MIINRELSPPFRWGSFSKYSHSIRAHSTLTYDLLPFNTLMHMITIKLSSFNYLLWKSQLLPLFESQDMLGYVDGTMVPSPRFELETSSILNAKYLA